MGTTTLEREWAKYKSLEQRYRNDKICVHKTMEDMKFSGYKCY